MKKVEIGNIEEMEEKMRKIKEMEDKMRYMERN